MQLLYLWLEKYNNIENQGFNFSQDFEIQYSKESNELTFNKKENQLPKNFFAENISSVTAIVGKNGTGKSSILAAICYFLANTGKVERTRIPKKPKFQKYKPQKPLKNPFQKKIVLCFLKKEEKTIYCFDGMIQNGACNFHYKQKIQPLDEYDGYKIKKISEIAEYEKFREHLLGLLYAVQTNVEYYNVAEKSMLFLTENGLTTRGNLNDPIQRTSRLYEKWKQSIGNKMLLNLWLNSRKTEVSVWPKDITFTPQIGLATVISRDSNRNHSAYYYGITEGKEKILRYFLCAMDDFLSRIYLPSTEAPNAEYIRQKVQKTIAEKNFTKEFIEAIFNNINNGLDTNDKKEIVPRNMGASEEKFQIFFTNLMQFVDAVDTTKYKLKFEDEYLNLDFLQNDDLAKLFIGLLRETETFLPNFFIVEKEEIYSTGQQVRLNMLSRFYWYADAEMLKEKKHILLMIDEGEATLHPEWQRNYFSWVLDLCEHLKKEVQLIFTTHSPFLLADIPKQNVIALGDSKEKILAKETFAANIHAMLAHSFFMSGTMGEFAFKKMRGVIDFLQSDKNDDRELKDCKVVIDLIGEPILKKKLLELYHNKLPNEEKIKALKLEIKRLEEEDLEEERQRKEKEDLEK